jgi:c(7)-type cytochrome triheme protein
MKKVFAVLAVFAVVVAAGTLFAEDKKAPEKITYAAKPGEVTFDHAKHVEKAKGDCKACHPAVFEQAQNKLGEYKAGMHKTAEAEKKFCGHCHVAGGAAFESKGNCAKCHVKK